VAYVCQREGVFRVHLWPNPRTTIMQLCYVRLEKNSIIVRVVMRNTVIYRVAQKVSHYRMIKKLY